MNANHELPEHLRIDSLARREGMERSLYLGEAIGQALLIAWGAFGSIGSWMHRAPARLHPHDR
jgi:hypothetical protein